ncbi:MAG: VWA domain-containing protein [Prevotellaceae bacterium]|jgi:Ca-activated chloride channel family protein|nr:VWA domain-containing protein [Prevotellaceae bacterium]
MTFNNPEYLWLWLLLIPMAVWLVFKPGRGDASLQMSSTKPFERMKPTKRYYLFFIPWRLLAMALIVVAIARPQLKDSYQSQTIEGIDIMLAIDISGSMLSQDLSPNRLDAAKNVAMEFISSRPDDNIGLVIFSRESFTQCPLTNDHSALINLFKEVSHGMVEDGTAIGLGLANAVNRLKDSQAKSKVIILLTDGTNNAGDISPLTAAEIAKTYGIRVYTVGAGTRGMAKTPVYDQFGNIHYVDMQVEIDETTLQSIATLTGGSYFRATDVKSLHTVYQEIDQMEKTKLQVREYSKKSEEYSLFLFLALIALLGELLMQMTVLRHLP